MKSSPANAVASAQVAPETKSQGPAPVTSVGGEDAAKTRPDRIGRSNVTAYVSLTTKKQLRYLAVECDTTIQELMIEALNDLFEKHKKPAIAESGS